MKNTIKESIISSLRKIDNLSTKVEEISGKLERLNVELEKIQDSIQREEERIENLGLRTPSRDPARPDTPEAAKQKELENSKLFEEKRNLISQYYEKYPESAKRPTPTSPLLRAAQKGDGSFIS